MTMEKETKRDITDGIKNIRKRRKGLRNIRF